MTDAERIAELEKQNGQLIDKLRDANAWKASYLRQLGDLREKLRDLREKLRVLGHA